MSEGSIEFPCPGCAAPFVVQAENAGRRGLCPGCNSPFTVPSAPPPPEPAPATRPKVRLELSTEFTPDQELLSPVGVDLPEDWGERMLELAKSGEIGAVEAAPATSPTALDPSPGGASEAAEDAPHALEPLSKRAPLPRAVASPVLTPEPPQALAPSFASSTIDLATVRQRNLVLIGVIVGLLGGGAVLGLILRANKAPEVAVEAQAGGDVEAPDGTSPLEDLDREHALERAARRARARAAVGRAFLGDLVARLEREVATLGQDRPLWRQAERQRLAERLTRLRKSAAGELFGARLDSIDRTLSWAAREEEREQTEAAALSDRRRAWNLLGERAQALASAALGKRGQGWTSFIERRLDPRLRSNLGDSLQARASHDPAGVLDLVATWRWHGVLDSGAYASLVRAGDALVKTSAWPAWGKTRADLLAAQRASAAYHLGHAQVFAAYRKRDLAAAQAVASAIEERKDTSPWALALVALVRHPGVVRAFKATGERGKPEAGLEPGPTELEVDWRERFVQLAKAHKKANKSERAPIAAELRELLDRVVGLAKQDHHVCLEAIELLDEHGRLVASELERLGPPRDSLHKLYFDEALRLASGPADFHALDAWCKAHERDDWRVHLREWLVKASPRGPGKLAKREQARQRRAEAMRATASFARRRVRELVGGLSALIDWLEAERYAPAARKAELRALITRAVARVGETRQAVALIGRLDALQHEERKGNKRDRTYARKLRDATNSVIKRSLRATERALAAGEAGLAFDLFNYVLVLDPDNDSAHKGLGHVKKKGEWVRRFHAEQLAKGLDWDSSFGWVIRKERARYARGEVYDPALRRWLPLAQANEIHSEASRPWVIRTEHFELRSTAPLANSARIAEHLERFFLGMFRQYDLFFAHKGGAKLVFGVVNQAKPLVVNVYRDHAQYLAEANPTPGSAGFYSPSLHASFFSDEGERTGTLQHEITHQILGETSGGGAAAWLGEGAAVYLQDSSYRDGVMVVGGVADNARLRQYARNLSRELSLTQVVALSDQGDWNARLTGANYRGAGAVVHFFMRFDGGRYRGDFLRMLRDSYYGLKVDPQRYFDLPLPVLDELMRRFYAARAK